VPIRVKSARFHQKQSCAGRALRRPTPTSKIMRVITSRPYALVQFLSCAAPPVL
jgi:hypothetical protein